MPPLILPLALQTANFGTMWALTANDGLLGSEAAETVHRLQDFCSSVAVLLLLAAMVRGCILGGRAVFTEACSLQFQPAYSAGMMSVFAIAMWLHQRGMPVGVCIGIWMVDCVLMVIGQFLFLYHLSAGVRNRAAGVSVMQQLWTMAVPPWFVP